MRRLVERVDLEPAARMADGAGVVGPRRAGLDQALEHGAELAAQGLGLEQLPVLEGGAIAHREALEQVAAEEREGLLELPLGGSGRGQGPEPVHVDLEVRSAHEGHPLPGGLDVLLADRLAQGRERPPQGPAGVLGVAVGPHQIRERIARMGPVDEREIGEERHGLAGVDGHGHSVARDARRAEKRHGERHSATIMALPRGLVTPPGAPWGGPSIEGDGAVSYHSPVVEPANRAMPPIDPVRAQRIREDAQRPMSANLAEGIALSHMLLRFVGIARPR